jgi:Spy/CpxP family protein refolding chaperone
MTRRLALALGLAALIPAALGAQVPRHEPSLTQRMKHTRSFEDLLFPPELVMQLQRELNLTAAQRATITNAIKALQSGVVDHQWQLLDEQEKLHQLLGEPTVEEAAVLAQVDRVLDLERNVKRLHLATLVRIKNALTPEQQKQLMDLHHGPEKLHEQFNEP